MKYWYILVIFIIAMAVVVIGALFKIMHWPGASNLLMFGMGTQFITLILLAGKVIADKKNNASLNK
jgi:hypothetical protein